MASPRASRLLAAAGLAIAIAAGPAVSHLAGDLAGPSARTLADVPGPGCANSGAKGSTSIACTPVPVAGGFGPQNESQLTQEKHHGGTH